MRLREAARAMRGQLIGPDLEFSSVSTDTRSLQPSELFFALNGSHFDATEFLSSAEERGACAVVTNRKGELSVSQIVVDDTTIALGRLAHHKRQAICGKVVAVTGSSGKTTVKGMLAAIFTRCGSAAFTEANFNNHIGVPKTILSAADDVDFLVVEVGTSGRGEISYLADIVDADIAVVNNVQPAHMEGFGSLEAIEKEKSDLISGGERPCIAVLPEHLFENELFKRKIDRQKRVVFSESKRTSDIDIQARNIIFDEKIRATFDFKTRMDSASVQLRVRGTHQVHNALAAGACAYAAGIEIKDIAAGLGDYDGDKGRMKAVDLPEFTLIDDSYNANPGSMRAAIDFLAKHKDSMLVVGDMGELGESAGREHIRIGDYAREKKIKYMCAIGDYAQSYKAGFGTAMEISQSKDQAVRYILENAKSTSTVLVKGSRYTKMEDVCECILDAVRGNS